MRGLEGKVALCTGAGRAGGLGHGILQRLGQAGCRLVVSDLDSVLKAAESSSDAAASVVADLKAQGFDVIDVACDVSDETSVAEAIKTVMAYYCLLYTSPSPRDKRQSRMPSSA